MNHKTSKVNHQNFEGKKLKLISSLDPYCSLISGSLGTVNFVDDAGTIHVEWNDGSSLGLIPEIDKWIVIQ